MNREEEKEKAAKEYINNKMWDDEIEECAGCNGFRNDVNWADSHPSRELIEKILSLAYDWDSLDWDGFVDAVKENIWNNEER